VHFEVFERRAGVADVSIVAWDAHFDPLPGASFDAQPLDADALGIAVDYLAGDQLVLKYTGVSAKLKNAYVPDGDGGKKNGRNPYVTLPIRLP
jgi:hypothetical protein